MTRFQYGVVTLSYSPDFERCRILCRSIDQFLPPKVNHYILVDQREIPLFQQLQTPRTQLIAVESLLPWWIKRLPFARRWWLSLTSLPIRNWILQQIVKISLSQYISDDVLIFADSDVAFIKPVDMHFFERGDQVRLFRIPGGGNIPSHYKWHQTAGRLLGIPLQDYYGARYIGNVITWKRENVLKLYRRIEETFHRKWTHVLARQWNLSEYVLYGVFVDQVLKENSGHFYDATNPCLEYWETEDMDDQQVEKFLQRLLPDHFAIMLSSKAPMSKERYQSIVEAAQQRVKKL